MEKEWFDDGAYDATGSPWTRMFEKWNAERTKRRIGAAGVTSGRLLEVGVGSGYTLSFMRIHGFDVEGCDMSQAICRHTEKAYNIKMHCGPLSSVAGESLYDVIVMNHVLEHVSDPVDLLANARRLLRLGGILHIAVPNVDSWEASLSGWTSYQPYHLVYFTPAALTRALSRTGLVVRDLVTFEPFSGWFLALLRTGLSTSRAQLSDGKRAKRSPLIEFLYRALMLGSGAITFPMRKIQGALMNGEELACIAFRKD
jgi:2-polyprenyl-3-methyl-5-hydroxy-6-metoxy-1,4-benzoquinol methylase